VEGFTFRSTMNKVLVILNALFKFTDTFDSSYFLPRNLITTSQRAKALNQRLLARLGLPDSKPCPPFW